jgi:hypothetical protein
MTVTTALFDANCKFGARRKSGNFPNQPRAYLFGLSLVALI